MKKLIIVLIFLALISPVFGQNNSSNDSSGMYYVNVPVERVYPSSEGYIVQYRTGSGAVVSTIGIPLSWFTDPSGAAELLRLPTAGDWPTMSVFYQDGKFSHVRLYVHRVKSHVTWGSIPVGTDLSRFFTADRESFDIRH
ncbi:MAG: hypothetical protein LBI28_06865 [Treponema sp.]|jgi:hypothetical protein|nr:hypothetical protein [Treponema sp.]